MSCILKIRLDQASRYEDNSAFPGTCSKERQLFEQRHGGHQGIDGRRSSLWLEHRVHERMSCKVNCKGRLRLNTRGPPSMPKLCPKLLHTSSLGTWSSQSWERRVL